MKNPATPLAVSEFSDLNNVAAWFIRLRWIAAIGVFISLLFANYAWPRLLPFATLFVLNGMLIALNAIFHAFFSLARGKTLSKSELAIFFTIQICSDYVLLFLLVYFTGFLENPFAYFFVFHILMTAYIFPATRVFLYVTALVIAFAGVALAEYQVWIPHFALFNPADPCYFQTLLPETAGMCATLIISGYLGTSIKKRMEAHALHIEIELNRYMSLDKVKSGFILQVTHELRGPLAAVAGYHEMISRGITGPVGEKTRDALAKATRRTESLLMMIDEMIDYAYMQTGTKQLDSSPISLRGVIEGIAESLQALADSKQITIKITCPPDLAMQGNRDLVNIIVGNLVSNALRYSPADSTVFVSASREAGEICLEVRDHGIGMSPEELSRIFEEFYRTRRARELERDGTGLGLSIIKKAVESLGGRITVASEIDKGSIFHIFFKGG